MTKAEAITILEVSKHMATSGRMYNQAIDMAIEALSERTGEWIEKDMHALTYCSNCDYAVDGCESKEYNFCPNCGARMVNNET